MDALMAQSRNTIGEFLAPSIGTPPPRLPSGPIRGEVMEQIPIGVTEEEFWGDESDIYRLSEEEERTSKSLIDPVYKRWPNMKKWLPDYKVKDSRTEYARPEDADEPNPQFRGALEHYDKNETGPPREPGDRTNRPFPGHNTIEIFKPLKERGEDVTQALFGDMLHGLHHVNPEYAELRREFGRAILNDSELLKEEVDIWKRGSDNRDFGQYLEYSRLDAFIRGLVSPDKANDWAGVYTPEMRKIGRKITALLETPVEDGQ
jgi:hypothetical protein